MANAPRDENHVPTILGVSSADGVTPTKVEINPVSGRMKIDITGAAMSPLTTKGDLYTYDTADTRLPVGTDGQSLVADSAEVTGLKWTTPAGGGDMVLADIQSVTGLKTFDKDKAAMKGTSTGVNTVSVANISATSYTNTIPAKTGTFAMTSDITGINSGTNTGDQTSIVGISGTTAQFNTALSDGSFATGGGTATGTNTGDQTNITGNAATVTTNANLTGPITSVGNATSIASQTGTGTKIVVDTSPTLITPLLGTPTSGVMTNVTGTASGLTAGTVTTNANLTGDVTSVGNATTIAAKAVDVAMLADGTDGELITWSAAGVAATVAVGTATHVLTSNGVGVAPTFQAASGGASYPSNIYTSSSQTGANSTIFTFTHNLGINQTDVEIGKYKVVVIGTRASVGKQFGDTTGASDLWGGRQSAAADWAPSVDHYWSAADPGTAYNVHHQANVTKILLGTAGVNINPFYVTIQQMYA